MTYGQVNHETTTLTKPAMIVSTIANHHHMFRVRKREINLRKKNKKANLTKYITSHQVFVAAFSSFEILGISPSSSNAKPFSEP